MIRPPIDRVLGALVDIGQPTLSTYYAPNCCIAATRLATRVLELTGYQAYPQVMWARAGNAAFCDAVMDDQPEHEWEARGVRYVEVNTEATEPGRFAGHLVAVCHGTLIDLSAGQFNRPEKNIIVPASVALDIPPQWKDVPIGRQLDGGGILIYRARYGALTDYRDAPDWNVGRVLPAVDATLEALAWSMA